MLGRGPVERDTPPARVDAPRLHRVAPPRPQASTEPSRSQLWRPSGSSTAGEARRIRVPAGTGRVGAAREPGMPGSPAGFRGRPALRGPAVAVLPVAPGALRFPALRVPLPTVRIAPFCILERHRADSTPPRVTKGYYAFLSRRSPRETRGEGVRKNLVRCRRHEAIARHAPASRRAPIRSAGDGAAVCPWLSRGISRPAKFRRCVHPPPRRPLT